MSSQEKFHLKKIEDNEIIRNLDKLPLFVPSIETKETYDKEQLKGLKISKSNVGELEPVKVAVWFDDPNKDSDSPNRIHLRIIDGRHRLKNNPDWKREYFEFSGYQDPILECHKARLHFDMQKKRTKSETRILIKEIADHLYNDLGISKHQVCQKVTEFFVSQGSMSAMTVSRYLSDEYKDPNQQAIAKSKRKRKSHEDNNKPIISEPSKALEQIEDISGQENASLKTRLAEKENIIAKLEQQHENVDKQTREMIQIFNKVLASKAELIMDKFRIKAWVDQKKFEVVIEIEEIPKFNP